MTSNNDGTYFFTGVDFFGIVADSWWEVRIVCGLLVFETVSDVDRATSALLEESVCSGPDQRFDDDSTVLHCLWF